MPPTFRRAVNVFQYFVDHCIDRTNKAIAAGSADGDPDVDITDTDLRRKWERTHNYARLFREAYDGYNRDLKSEKGKMSDVEWTQQRQVSAGQNLERYKVCFPESQCFAGANVLSLVWVRLVGLPLPTLLSATSSRPTLVGMVRVRTLISVGTITARLFPQVPPSELRSRPLQRSRHWWCGVRRLLLVGRLRSSSHL